MALVFWGFLNSPWLQMHDLKIIWLSSSFLDLSVKFVLVGYNIDLCHLLRIIDFTPQKTSPAQNAFEVR